jgi:hypothetical protein
MATKQAAKITELLKPREFSCLSILVLWSPCVLSYSKDAGKTIETGFEILIPCEWGNAGA